MCAERGVDTASSSSNGKKVLLFGLSGNPPTGRGGHSGIVEYFVSQGGYDEIWMLPVYRHMFTNKREDMAKSGAPTFEQRMDMCKLAFERLSSPHVKVHVLPFEKETYEKKAKDNPMLTPKELRVSTFDVVSELRRAHPACSFTFAVGTDAYNDLLAGRWQNADRLRALISFVVVDRHGLSIGSDQTPHDTSVHHIPDLTDISSTAIRNASDITVLTDAHNLDASVLEYIRKNRLYIFRKGAQTRRRAAAGVAAASVAVVAVIAWAAIVYARPRW